MTYEEALRNMTYEQALRIAIEELYNQEAWYRFEYDIKWQADKFRAAQFVLGKALEDAGFSSDPWDGLGVRGY